jgi:hypothetical protein
MNNDPASSTKRQLDEVDQPPAKKARLSNAHQPGVEGEGAQPADKAWQHTPLWDQVLITEPGQTPALQHPKPKPPYASFLDEFVDPVQPCSGTDSEHSFVLEWLESVGSDVEEYFRTNNFPLTRTTESLQRSDRQPMAKHAVPNTGYNIKLIIGMQWA